MKKYFMISIYIIAFILVMSFPVEDQFIRFNSAEQALKYSRNVKEIYVSKEIDEITLFYYLDKDNRMVYDMVLKESRGYKLISKATSNVFKSDDAYITFQRYKEAPDLIFISNNGSQLNITDNMSSTVYPFTITTDIKTFYITFIILESIPKDYQLYSDGEELELIKID